MFNSMNTRDPQGFSKYYVSRNSASLTERDRDRMKCQKSVGLPKFYGQKTALLYYSRANMFYLSRKRKSDSKGTASSHGLLSPGLETLPHWSLK